MIKQSDAIRDYVFPIANVARNANGLAFIRFLGTGFLIGNRGFGLIAAHVAQDFDGETVVAMFASGSSGWEGIPITHSETYAHEDVAVVKVEGDSWKSFFRLSN